MKETIDLLGKIITNILTALYEPFGFSLLLSFLAMFFYLYAYEPSAAGKGWKSAIVTWYQKFKESVFFRKLFLLAFVTSLILFRTLLNRNLWRDFLNFPYFTGFPAPLNSEMICIFPYFCPYAESARKIREFFI